MKLIGKLVWRHHGNWNCINSPPSITLSIPWSGDNIRGSMVIECGYLHYTFGGKYRTIYHVAKLVCRDNETPRLSVLLVRHPTRRVLMIGERFRWD
jgi:hypothetical protein